MLNKIGVAVGTALISVSSAWAGPQLESPKSNCLGTNCSGMTIRGIHYDNNPFIVQVYARANECLRLDVSSQTEDMAMLLATPSVNFGMVSDDREFPGDLRPLIVMDPVPITGWYTVSVSYFELEDIDGRFTLEYGRYGSGNPNCQAPAATAGQQLQRLGGDPAKVSAPAATGEDDAGQDEKLITID
jgi:hypothetical protein